MAGNVVFNPVYAADDFVHGRLHIQRSQIRLDDLDLRRGFIVCLREWTVNHRDNLMP